MTVKARIVVVSIETDVKTRGDLAQRCRCHVRPLVSRLTLEIDTSVLADGPEVIVDMTENSRAVPEGANSERHPSGVLLALTPVNTGFHSLLSFAYSYVRDQDARGSEEPTQ